MQCSGRTSVHLCTASLQNLAGQQDFYSLLGVPMERSCKPRIRWYGTGGFQEQGQCLFIGLSCSIPTIVFYSFSFSLLSVSRLVLWGWGLRTDRVTDLSSSRTKSLNLVGDISQRNTLPSITHHGSTMMSSSRSQDVGEPMMKERGTTLTKPVLNTSLLDGWLKEQ